MAEHVETRSHDTHWVSWLLRALIAAALAAQLFWNIRGGWLVPAIGLVLTFVPWLISAWSKRHVPRVLEVAWVAAVTLLTISQTFNLSSTIQVWDKLVHFVELLLVAWMALVLLFGYRDTFDIAIPVKLLVATAIFFSITVGTVWEMIEFVVDYFVNQNLVQSTLGTLLDLLVDSLGAMTGALAAAWAYGNHLSRRQQVQLGRLANWLAGLPSEPPSTSTPTVSSAQSRPVHEPDMPEHEPDVPEREPDQVHRVS